MAASDKGAWLGFFDFGSSKLVGLRWGFGLVGLGIVRVLVIGPFDLVSFGQ